MKSLNLSKFLGPRFNIGFKLLVYFTFFATLMRLVFVCYFYPAEDSFTINDLIKAIYLGLKFDLRVSLIFCLPYFIFSLIPKFNPVKNNKSLPYWTALYCLLLSLLLQVYLQDFAYYDYLKDRLNATILQFTENLYISMEMVWQSYPMVSVLIGSFFVLILFYKTLNKFVFSIQASIQDPRSKKNIWLGGLLTSFLIFLGLYGRLNQYPLRWSEVFFSGNRYIAAVGTNPLHYFFDTLTNSRKNFDSKLVKKYYPIVSSYLGVETPDPKSLNFTRFQNKSKETQLKNPNVVVIIMESLSAHRSGLFLNPTEATPNLDKMGQQGWLFTKHFTPSEGTARGVFATVTGIADINKDRTSSRNPLIVDQNTAVNYFTGYEPYYFIGGSANWGNIRGVLKNNIQNLNLYEEDMFDAPRTDVWGISDYHLFKESFRILNHRPDPKKPFFAFIQTAGFHRPYTIPEDHGDFKPTEKSLDFVKKWGFESLEEYESMRFADYSLGVFIDSMKSSPMFDNTLFVVLGDHGLPDNESKNLTPTQIKFSLERFHTPLVFYMPKHLEPKTFDFVVSQQDVLPTITALSGFDFKNKGMGRNVLDPQFDNKKFVFSYVYYRNPHTLFLFDENYIVTGIPGQINEMYNYTSPDAPKEISAENTEKFQQMSDLLNGLYETAKYLLHNNRK